MGEKYVESIEDEQSKYGGFIPAISWTPARWSFCKAKSALAFKRRMHNDFVAQKRDRPQDSGDATLLPGYKFLRRSGGGSWTKWDQIEHEMDAKYTWWNLLEERRWCCSRTSSLPRSGLIMKGVWLDLVLKGLKTWEIRGVNTTKREVVALIQSGSGRAIGEARVIDSVPLSYSDLVENMDKHCIQDLSIVEYSKVYAWVLTNAMRYEIPQPYKRHKGAIIWIHLEQTEEFTRPSKRRKGANASASSE